MEGRVIVGKREWVVERVRHGKGIRYAGWGRDGRKSDGGERRVGS